MAKPEDTIEVKTSEDEAFKEAVAKAAAEQVAEILAKKAKDEADAKAKAAEDEKSKAKADKKKKPDANVKRDLVGVSIPRSETKGDDAVSVIINGEVTRIARGRQVPVPKEVAEVLANSDRQDTYAFDLMTEIQSKDNKIIDL